MAGLGGLVIGLAVVGVLVASASPSPPGDVPAAPTILPVLASGHSAEAERNDEARDFFTSFHFEATGPLEVMGGEDQVWSVGADLDRGRLAALATALDLAGAVRETAQGWEMADGDRHLVVQRQPGLPWSYTTAAPPDMSSPPRPRPPDDPVGDPVSPEDARVVAGEIATAVGIDVDQAAVRINPAHLSQWVGFEPAVGAVPTLGMSTSVLVAPGDEVEQASGHLAVPEAGEVVPLLDTAAALDRLHRVQPIPPSEGRDASVVEVTGVYRALQFVPAPGSDRAWLVPAYAFETAEGALSGRPSVVAVVDEHLAEPPEPEQPVLAPEDTRRCVDTGVGAEDLPGDQVPGVRVCLDGQVTAGEVAVFELMATDPDSDIRDDCGSPVVVFGDEENGPFVCYIGCIQSPGTGPGELRRSFEHVYAEPGSYRATFSLVGCGPEYLVELTFPLTVGP